MESEVVNHVNVGKVSEAEGARYGGLLLMLRTGILGGNEVNESR